MTISDETLMAYADGELESSARRELEFAMHEFPTIAARLARHRGLRQRVQALNQTAEGAARQRDWQPAISLK